VTRQDDDHPTPQTWVNVNSARVPGNKIYNLVTHPDTTYCLTSSAAERLNTFSFTIILLSLSLSGCHYSRYSAMKKNILLNILGWISVASAAFDLNRGGGVLKAPEGDSFATVTGTFIVPNLSGANRLSIWVGIGDSLQQNYVLAGGIVYNNTLQSFSAYWQDPVPDATSTVPIVSGNSITVTVNTAEAGGIVTIENTTQNKTTTQSLSAPAGVDPTQLTALAANWFVQAYQVTPGELVQMPNFGTVTFTACSATTKNGVSVPITGAGRYEIQGTSGQVSVKTHNAKYILTGLRYTRLQLSLAMVSLSRDRLEQDYFAT
jgi:hypothetical protein